MAKVLVVDGVPVVSIQASEASPHFREGGLDLVVGARECAEYWNQQLKSEFEKGIVWGVVITLSSGEKFCLKK